MAKRAAPPIRTAHTDDPIASAGLRVPASHASTVEPLHPDLASLALAERRRPVDRALRRQGTVDLAAVREHLQHHATPATPSS